MFCAIATGATMALTLALTASLRPLPYAWCWEAVLAVPFLQQYATLMRARAVAAALSQGNMDEAAHAIAVITPRAVAPENEPQAVRRTVEAMAWHLSAGIVAPAFWLALFGLPGIVCVATLASTERHAATAHTAMATAMPMKRTCAPGCACLPPP